mmetsp:Transcript_8317/g.15054  ORF Transcript_8317/g.15054 Transcript_8317/m.15054 type:complete len:632 (-) Transcript_8317:30-1925(-)
MLKFTQRRVCFGCIWIWTLFIGCMYALDISRDVDPDVISVPVHFRPRSIDMIRESLIARPWIEHDVSKSDVKSDRMSRMNRVLNGNDSQISQVVDSGIINTKLFGSLTEIGEYFVKIRVEGQVIHAQLDTGSAALAVPLSDCENCRVDDRRVTLSDSNLSTSHYNGSYVSCDDTHICSPYTCDVRDPFRNSLPSSSRNQCGSCSASTKACCSLNQPDACGFALLFADGSGAKGALVKGHVELANGVGTDIVFGGILSDTPNFERSKVDGILGMAFEKLSCNPSCTKPLFSEIVRQGKVKHDIFSVCTAPSGGVLTLGGADRSLYDGELQFVSLSKQGRGFYDVSVSGFLITAPPSLRNRSSKSKPEENSDDDLLHSDAEPLVSLQLPQFDQAIVDSGTTLLVTTSAAFKTLRKHFFTYYCHVPGLCNSFKTWFSHSYCVRLSDREVDLLPTIAIVLSDQSGRSVQLNLNPKDYMIQVEKTHSRCLGIHSLPGLEVLGNNVIIGNTLLRKYYTVYDRENLQLGFAPAVSDCSPKDEDFNIDTVQDNEDGSSPGLMSSQVKETSGSTWIVIGAVVVVVGLVICFMTIVWMLRRQHAYRSVENDQVVEETEDLLHSVQLAREVQQPEAEPRSSV